MLQRINSIASLFLIVLFLLPDGVRSAQAWEQFTQSFEEPARFNGALTVASERQPRQISSQPEPAIKKIISAPNIVLTFPAMEEVAYLGKHASDPMNQPANDAFRVKLEGLTEGKKAYLSYQVNGLEKGVDLPKSINGMPSYVGGKLTVSEGWQTVIQAIPISQLREGVNVIRFHAPYLFPSWVEVKDLHIRLSDEVISSPALTQLVRHEALPENFTASLDEVTLSAYSVEDIDMPSIPRNIVNVTRNSWGYLVPGQADQNVQVKIGVDRKKIPAGTGLEEVQIFYFDHPSQTWQVARAENIDMTRADMESQGPAGTDYFAGLIKTPEMPEASAFMPTTISDIKAANPSAEMNIMQPPSVSQTGEASINYPLVIPSGRQGVQPNINLTYSSDAGTGWMGVGWNISVPSVEIDTRWGVPAFDANLESEVYTIKGESLTREGGVKANRAPGTRLSSLDSVHFFPRTMRAYKKIVRYGTDPTNYRWEEVSAGGMHFYYGTTDGSSVDASSTLTDSNGNILRWYLRRVEDRWGNRVTYNYTSYDNTSSGNIKSGGQQLVLDNIRYTGFGSDPGAYEIVFETSGNRQDGRVMMNLGEKILDDRQLNSVKVNHYEGSTATEVVRFDFHYINGDFDVHPLLQKVVEYRSGDYFYKHTFEYHHGQLDFESPQDVSIGHFNNRLFDGLPDEIAAISGPLGDVTSASGIKTTITKGWGAGGSVGLGVAPGPWPFPDKTFSFSGRLGYSQTESRDKLSLDDMNGDGLPDLIYDKGNGARYHPLRMDENGQFAFTGYHRINISGDLLESYSTTFSYGFDFALPANIYYYGRNWNETNSKVQRYLTDYNADGIKDLVLPNGGVPMVYFGELSKSGEIGFNPSSEFSINPVVKGTTPITPPVPQDTLKDLELVRVWIAPYEGHVDINGFIEVKYTTEDYVYAAVQKNGSFEKGMMAITDTTVPTSFTKTGIWVDKEDTLTFRLRSNQNGYGDVVKWNPKIDYQSGVKKDGNGSNYGNTEYRDNFLLSAYEAVQFWGDEALKVSWPTFGVSGMSDDVTLRVHILAQDVDDETVVLDEHYDYVVPRSSSKAPSPSQFKAPGQSSAPSFMSSLTAINDLESYHLCHLSFEVLSTSNVDWKEVDWRPKVEFGPECGQANSIQYPAVYYQTYNRVMRMDAPFNTSATGDLVVWPSLGTTNFTSIFHPDELGQGGSYRAYMIVKGKDVATQGMMLEFFENSVSYYEIPAVFGDPGSTGLTLSQTAANHNFSSNALDNGDVYVEFFTPNRRLAELLKSKAQAHLYEVVDGREDPESRVTVSDLSIFFQERSEFNDFLLGWGQFCWSNLSQNAIPTGKMKQDRSLAENNDYSEGKPPSTSSLDNNQALQDMNPMEQEFWPLNAVRGERPMVNGAPINTANYEDLSRLDRWSVLGTYVAAYNDDGLTVPGKFGEEPRKPQLLPPASPGTFGAMATLQFSKSLTLAKSAGPSIPGTGVSFVHSSTINDQNKYYSESQTSFMDINGDAYPDIVTAYDGVDAFLTDPQGGHRGNSVDIAPGKLSKSVTSNQADVVSGTFVNEDARFLNMKASATAGASLSMGDTENLIEWADMNGDGIPDRINNLGGSSVGLELGNGSGLYGVVPLASTGSPLSENLSIGLNAGLAALSNTKSGLGLSFSGGIGINKVGGESKKMYMDMNGDGLTDLIEESSGTLKLYLNNGTTFQLYNSANLSQIDELNKREGLGISGNIAGTFSFPLGSFLFFHFKMSISGNVQGNYATNNQISAFRDMNGDGVVDYIRDEDGGLKIYQSKVGKSNLLKKVTNPLKGTFTIDYERKGNRYGAYAVEVPIHTTVEGEEMIWDMPSSKWVLQSLVIDDGLHVVNSSDEDIDGWDDMEYKFRYDGGIKSRREREFLGFTRVEKSYRPNRDDIPLTTAPDDPRKFWIAEVSDYFRPDKNQPNYRKRFEYMKGLSPNNYKLLHEQWTAYVYQGDNNPPLLTDFYEITMISHDKREYEFREVSNDRSDNLNFTKVVLDDEDFVPVIWSTIDETQTLFPALTATEHVVAPQLAPLHTKPDKDKYQMSRFEYKYDPYFNVVEKVDQGISADVNTQLVVVDTIEVERYEFYELEFNNLDIETRNPPFNEPIYQSGSGELCFLLQEEGYVPDTLCLSDYILTPMEEDPCWDREDPPSGGDVEDYAITLRRKTIETIYIEEEIHSTNFKAPVFAWMEYFLPDEAAGRTNVLQDHKIFIGDTDNGLTRHSHVDNLTTDQKAVKNMAQYSTSSIKSVTSFLYDTYGNVSQIEGPENHQLQRMAVDFTYDNDQNQFITTVSNSYGDQVCTVYDPATGKRLKSVDINGHAMGYDYDQFHRLVRIYVPGAMRNNGMMPTISFSYHPTGIDSAAAYGGDYQSGVPVAITHHNINLIELSGDPEACFNGVDGNPAEDCTEACDFEGRPAINNSLKTATFIDGMQRVVQVKKEVPKMNSNQTDNVKQKLVSGITEYDRQWRDSTLSLQIEEEITSGFPLGKLNTLKSADHQMKSTYDYAGRVISTLSPVEAYGSFANTTKTYEWATLDSEEYFSEVTNHEGQITRTYNNSRGQTVASTQSDAGTTRFTRDPLDQLLKVEDPVGDTTTYIYDLMGRTLDEYHPDRGHTVLTYDKAGNRTTVQTPEIAPATISMTYQYNRLVQKDYPNSNDINKVIFEYGHRDDGKNGAGRIVRTIQGVNFKVEYYKYDEFGHLIYEKKSLKLPKGGLRHFTNEFEYDVWGRIQQIDYPDGERVNYTYGPAGELNGINPTQSPLFPHPNPIVNKILYDGFENVTKIKYGNNTETNFTYSPYSRRMLTQQLDVSGGILLNKTFTYEATGNVHRVRNLATGLTVGSVKFGGEYDHTYTYDDAGRLTRSVSDYGDPDQNGNQNYLELNLTYNSAGGITNKTLINLNRQNSALLNYNYDHDYTYKSANPHQLDRTDPSHGLSHVKYQYNDEGSIIQQTSYIGSQFFSRQEFLWNEEQRLSAVKNDNGVHHYVYDQNGERILKGTLRESGTAQNGQGTSSCTGLDPYIVYASPYFVATHYQQVVEASKHYYMNNQRVASALITYPYETEYDNSWPDPIGGGDPPKAVLENLQFALEEFGLVEGEDYNLEEMGNQVSIEEYHSEDAYNLAAEDCNDDEQCLCEVSMYWAQENGIECPEYRIMYWYHPDYLGNNEAITDQAGDPYQYFLYSPFGESVEHNHSYPGSYSTPWRFNGKEYDQETGNIYYGARYYDPRLSIWLSVDPKATQYPSLSPYVFVANNPINLVDPNGMEIDWKGNFFGALRGYLEMKTFGTNKTKQQWDAMANDANTLYTIDYSKTVGLGTNDHGQIGIAEGMTIPDEEAGINAGTQNDYKHVNLNIHTGTRKLKNEIMKGQGVDNWDDVANVDVNSYLQNGNHKVYNYDSGQLSDGSDFMYNFAPFSHPVRPNSNETSREFGQRVLGHESTHALMWGGHWTQKVKSIGGPHNQGESDAHDVERAIIRQQR